MARAYLVISYSLLNKPIEHLVIIVMELLRSNQDLEMRVAALTQHPDVAEGTLRERIVKRFRQYLDVPRGYGT
jgi:hypothetical protein